MSIYVNLMEVDLSILKIMKNLNGFEQIEYTSLDLLFEGTGLVFFATAVYPCILEDTFINMDLNEQLLSSLNQCVTSEKLCHIHELLMKGANPNIIDSFGNGPIHLAVLKSPENLELVLELIHFGSDLNIVNKYGSTPLMVSLYKRCHQTSAVLIKRGTDINFQCQRGCTALMIASMMGDLWGVRALLQHGVNVNAYDVTKKTALMYAVDGRYLDVIKELLDYGANPEMRNAVNKTALHTFLKRTYPNLNVVNELLLHCASFKDLENNPDASFKRIMDICLRGKPPYHRCVKTIIKIQMLLTYDYHCVTSFKDLYDFALDCCTEIRYMRHYDVSRCNTVETLLQKCLRGNLPKESELEALLPLLANNCFLIYSDILRALIRKSYLRKKFMKMLIYAKHEGQADEITLNSDINLRILHHLSDDDVSSFVMASYIRTNSQEKTSFEDSFLYPTGMIYSLNDLATS